MRENIQNQIEVVVFIELLIFFFSILSQMIFLLVSRLVSFRTARERLDLGGNMRYRKDFLEFVKDDIHYTIIIISQFLLNIYMILHRQLPFTSQAFVFKLLITAHLLY